MRDPKWGHHVSMIDFAIYLANHKDIQFAFRHFNNASVLAQTRQTALAVAIEEDFSHLLFIDDDMGFTPEAFEFLRSRNKVFVGANCVKRNEDRTPVAMGKEQELIYSADKTGIERITYTGMAFCLIDVNEVKKIPPPHFEQPWLEHMKKYLGEDKNFCWVLAKNDIPIFTDHDAARYVVHIGDFNYQEDFSVMKIGKTKV